MGLEETSGPAGRRLIRRACVAGTFYPGHASDLARTVDRLLDGVGAASSEQRLRAVVVPHAGYVYSGAVAAEGYALIRGSQARRVVVLGPSHFVPLRGMAVSVASAWRTPLGAVQVDHELREAALEAGAAADDRPHGSEHAIEVQIPFLQRALGEGWALLPVAVGVSEPGPVADLLGRLRGAADLIVVSTDLSHYLDEGSARRMDDETARSVLRLDAEGIGKEAACGRYPLRGLLAFAARQGLVARLLRLATSAEATGDRTSVVGYGAFALASTEPI